MQTDLENEIYFCVKAIGKKTVGKYPFAQLALNNHESSRAQRCSTSFLLVVLHFFKIRIFMKGFYFHTYRGARYIIINIFSQTCTYRVCKRLSTSLFKLMLSVLNKGLSAK